MTRTRRARLITTLGLAAIALTGPLACNTDDLLVEHPKTILVPDNLYVDVAGFEAGLNALYYQVRRERSGVDNSDPSNNITATAFTIGTDNGYGNYLSPSERLFQEFGVQNTSLNSFTNNIWTQMYQTINAANTLINRADNPAIAWTATDKARIVGEAKLVRAWAYRHLIYLFGDVPVTLTESSGDNVKTDWDRVPRDSVRKIIIQDLLDAEAGLPLTSTNNGKVTKAVAEHYLAEMYLWAGNNAAAETKAAAVVNSGAYKLITARYGVNASQPGAAFMDQFQDGNADRSQGNTEALWVLQYAENVAGGGGSIMRRSWLTRYESNAGMQLSPVYGGRGIGRLAITKWALGIYEAADVRGGQYAVRRFYLYNNPANLPAGKKIGDTLYTNGTAAEKVSNPIWPSTRKWDYASVTDPTGTTNFEDQPYIRLAETYLLLAEAQFKQGNLAGAAANINIVRARAGASAITPAQVTLDFILDERSRELVTEEQRRYTLIRTGTWLTRTKLYNPLAAVNVVARDSILPIPQAVIDANLTKKMPQNPGY
ncbi:MAG: RagB/SusD protein [Gemmatimonadetes bacterium]|nr:RagB/SusD protein [Gemmatimonadota bacterium]